MTTLALTRAGAGEPLVLLHGLGSSRAAWEPILPILSRRFDVFAFDLPGFGESDRLPEGTEPTPAALAAAVAATLHELDIIAPHIVGNSLGGWVALELAATECMSSLTLLSPAGLWLANTPLYCRISLRATRLLARFLGPGLRAIVRTRIGRLMVFALTNGHPTRMSPAQARTAITAIGKARGFRPTLRATLPRRYEASSPIHTPVTVCFGGRDRILPKRKARHLDELPAHTTTADLPGAGHVPMSDEPAAVALVIIRGTGRYPSPKDNTP
jgi:pimeloyl-ACP methyl ester carboxylesterase